MTNPNPIAEFPSRYALSRRFTLGSPRTFTVSGGGSGLFFSQSSRGDDPVQMLYYYDRARGETRLIFDPRSQGPETAETDDGELDEAEKARRERARESATGVVNYSTDAAGALVSFALDGTLWLVEVETGRAMRAASSHSVFDPRLNPAGTQVAYVSDGSLYRAPITPDGFGSPVLVRGDGYPDITNGMAEFVAAEEMGRSRGFWWAPDGETLIVTRVDNRPVGQWWISDPAHPDRQPRPIRYPMAGRANAVVALEVVTPSDEIAEIDWSEGGRFEYLADIVVQADHPVLLVRQTRDQKTLSVAQVDLDTGTVDEIRTITDDVWVELIPGSPQWSAAGLLTIEDTESTRFLCRDGQPITPPGLNVRSIVGLFNHHRQALITAWATPTRIQVMTVDLARSDGTNQHRPQPLVDQPGVQNAVVGGDLAVVALTSPDRAGTEVVVVSLDAQSSTVAPIANLSDRSWSPGFGASPQFMMLGEHHLPAALFLPSDHDGQSPLPVLLDPYGGPHAQRVIENHNSHLVSRWFAEQGYAVLVVDGRGVPGRGPDWERQVWGDLAHPVLADQIEGLDAALDRYPFLDRHRVAIRGWSFGGYLAALAVLVHPDRFAAAIAGAPVTSWHLYDTHYTERYLGHPEQFPDHYRGTDLIEMVQTSSSRSLKSALMLIHGLADDNVVAAHTLQLSSALLANGSPHQVLPLSEVTHMTPQVSVAENLLRLQLGFLEQTVGSRA